MLASPHVIVWMACWCSRAPPGRWLLDTFGRALLAAGAGVLDVAGGKGALAFELANLNGLRATVLDPRPLSLGRHAVLLQARMRLPSVRHALQAAYQRAWFS